MGTRETKRNEVQGRTRSGNECKRAKEDKVIPVFY
jgi:hypothetical protein